MGKEGAEWAFDSSDGAWKLRIIAWERGVTAAEGFQYEILSMPADDPGAAKTIGVLTGEDDLPAKLTAILAPMGKGMFPVAEIQAAIRTHCEK